MSQTRDALEAKVPYNVNLDTRAQAELSGLKELLVGLPQSPMTDFLKAFTCVLLKTRFEMLFDSDADPLPLVIDTCNEFSDLVKNLGEYVNPSIFQKYIRLGKDLNHTGHEQADVLERTAQMYGRLFPEFDQSDYVDEAYDLLLQRLTKNKIPLERIKGKSCLDAGCGGGRYTLGLARIGAQKVIGVDAASASIADAKRRCSNLEYKNCEFMTADVLSLPLADNSYDFVMSYGVLHHTTDPKHGIEECYRVLKPGGKLFIFLMSGTGLFYETLNMLREVLKPVSPSLTQAVMQLMGYPPNRIFNMVDLFHVPIQHGFSPEEMERMLREIGFVNIRRLERDVSTPYWTHYNEQIYQRCVYAELKYGSGDNKYVAQKD